MTYVTLTDTSCCVCGIVFAVPDHWLEKKRENGASFYCPNGHDLHYGKSRVQELEAKLAREKENTEFWRKQEQAQRKYREQADRKAAAAKGQVTKMKKRVGNGVCPCCNRQFQNLNRHMTTQHPDYAASE